jgi:hypothetical protein
MNNNETEYLQTKQFCRHVKESGGNFNVHTRSGIFEARGVDVEAVALLLLNTRALHFGNYVINPSAIDVIERVEVEAKKVSKGNTN